MSGERLSSDAGIGVECPHCAQVVLVPDAYAAVEALAAHLAAGSPTMCAPWQDFSDPEPDAICTCGHSGAEHDGPGVCDTPCQCGAFVSPTSPFWQRLTPPMTDALPEVRS